MATPPKKHEDLERTKKRLAIRMSMLRRYSRVVASPPSRCPVITDFCSETDIRFYPRLMRDWSNA